MEFEALVKEFTTDMSVADYAKFEENIPASEAMINEFEIDWRQRVREDSINAIQNPEIASGQVEKIPMMLGEMTKLPRWNKKAWVSKR